MSFRVKSEALTGSDMIPERRIPEPAHCVNRSEHSDPMRVPASSMTVVEPRTGQHNPENGGEASEECPIDNESIKGIFGWETVDNTSIPYILRKEKKFVSVRIVERKLLSKYPNTFPDELGKKDPLVSYFITEAEANLLNEINTAHCDFEYGHNPFTVKDLIVDLEEFEEFFKLVKKTFPADVLAKMGGESTLEIIPPAVKPDLSQFCGWIQINNTVSPYIIRPDNGRQDRLVPLSVIVYAAGLLTNSSVDGLLPTSQECAMLNEACRLAGFDFLFGKSTRLISISEVLHRCQVQLFELPFKNPLQHARYLDPCTGQPSSSPLMGFMPHPLSNPASVHHQPLPPSIRPLQGVMDLMTGNTAELNPYISGFPQPIFHPSQLTMPGGVGSISSGITGFREPLSPVNMHLPGPQPGVIMDPSRFPSTRSQMMGPDKSLDNYSSAKSALSGSIWAAIPRAPPPAHVNNIQSSMMSKTPPITPDPPVSSAFQAHSLPPNHMIHSRNSPALPDFSHPIFRSSMTALPRPSGSSAGAKDLPKSPLRYPLPNLLPTQYPNPPFSFGINQFESSLFTRTDQKYKPAGESHQLSSQANSLQNSGNDPLQYLMLHSPESSHHKTPNSGSLDFNQQAITTCPPNSHGNSNAKSDLSQNISACLVNGKSISCLNVNLPHRKGSFCLVEAVSKLYFPTVPLTEFVKVLQAVLKVNLNECSAQEERAFVQYYNLPVSKLKCNKIIRVDDLEAYFPQLTYIFTKCPSDPASGQPALPAQSPSGSAAQKRRLSSPPEETPAKTFHPKLETVVRMLQHGREPVKNGESDHGSNTGSDAPIIVIEDE